LAENKNQVGNGERLFDTRVYVSYIECISFKFYSSFFLFKAGFVGKLQNTIRNRKEDVKERLGRLITDNNKAQDRYNITMRKEMRFLMR